MSKDKEEIFDIDKIKDRMKDLVSQREMYLNLMKKDCDKRGLIFDFDSMEKTWFIMKIAELQIEAEKV